MLAVTHNLLNVFSMKYTVLCGPYSAGVTLENNSHHLKAVLVSYLCMNVDHSLKCPVLASRENIEAFELLNTDGGLLVVVLTDLKRLCGDILPHISGQRWMDRGNLVVLRYLYGCRQRKIRTGRRRQFRLIKN